MTVRIVPFAPEHAAAIAVQPAQAGEAMGLPTVAVSHMGPSWTALDDTDRVLCIAGIAVSHSEHGTAWASFAADKRSAMVPIARAMQRVIAVADYRRLDMVVRATFDEAVEFAELLGFRLEAVMHDWFPDGSAALMYRRANI